MQIKPTTYIHHEKSLFIEFETPELIEVEDAGDHDLFRIEMTPGEDPSIFVASEDSYYIYDDVTHMFDVQDVMVQCTDAILRKELEDHTKQYHEFFENEA